MPIINHIPIVKHVSVPKPFTIYRPIPVPVYEEPKRPTPKPKKGNFIYIPKGYAPYPKGSPKYAADGSKKPTHASVPGSIIEISSGFL